MATISHRSEQDRMIGSFPTIFVFPKEEDRKQVKLYIDVTMYKEPYLSYLEQVTVDAEIEMGFICDVYVINQMYPEVLPTVHQMYQDALAKGYWFASIYLNMEPGGMGDLFYYPDPSKDDMVDDSDLMPEEVNELYKKWDALLTTMWIGEIHIRKLV